MRAFRIRNDIFSNVLGLRLNPLDAFEIKGVSLCLYKYTHSLPLIGNANHPS